MADIDLPVVVDSSETTTEKIIAQDCPECGYDRARQTTHDHSGVHIVKCIACDYTHYAE